MLQIYKSFIRPHLDYCDFEFYSKYYSERARSDQVNTNSEFTNKIESVQYNASLAITGCVRGTSREKLFSELGLTSLYDSRRFHMLSLLQNSKPINTRVSSTGLIHDTVRRSHATRTNRYDVMIARTQKFRYCFFPDTSNSWNYISFIKSSPTLNVFKKGICNSLTSPLKYLTCLRVSLSHLRAHKFAHNFNDTSSKFCSCMNNKAETVEHFLLFCPAYSLLRSELFRKLGQVTSPLTFISPSYSCHLLLYGNPALDYHTKTIIELTIRFITSSQRFEVPFISND